MQKIIPDFISALTYMLVNKVYTDAFVLHDVTENDPYEKKVYERAEAEAGIQHTEIAKTDLQGKEDTRLVLHKTWTKWFKYQPIMRIRNYFGERIALYFAWVGTLISTLWFPAVLGVVCFIYGMVVR